MRQLLIAIVVAVASGALVLSGQTPQNPPRPPQPTFETRADLVLVDVTVVDGDSRPIEGLTAADFVLEVNGQPRPIQNLQFISTAATTAGAQTSARDRQYATNDAASTGRLLLFVADEEHLRMGANRAVMNTAGMLLDGLPAGDLVGLARLPDGIGGVEFTADRARVRTALERVTGKKSTLRINEMRLSEAFALESNDSFTWDRVIERECRGRTGIDLQACNDEQQGRARETIVEATRQAMLSMSALEQLVQRLALLKSPITVVLISEGLFVGRDRLNLSDFARRAAEARVTLHVVQPGDSMFDAGPPSAAGLTADDNLNSEGLEQLAGVTRGMYSRISLTSGGGTFERIKRELSGYYLLSFEPNDADRTADARSRRIKVEVKRRGVTVRARSTFAMPNASAAAAVTPQEHLKTLLQAPLPTTGLPIRLATYTVGGSGDGKVRVIISAEVGDPATDAVEWPVGILVFDKNNKPIVNSIAPMKLSPATVGESARLLLTSVVVDPGEYALRLGAVSPDGRGGSVFDVLDARLSAVAGDAVRASDLVLAAPPPPGEMSRPTASNVINADAVTAQVELSGNDAARLSRAKVEMEIAESETGPALVSNAPPPNPQPGGVRAFATTFRLGLLPPGEYIARAVISVPGQKPVHLTRAFLSAPPRADTASAADPGRVSADPDAAPALPPPPRIIAPLPRFAVADVLRAEVVGAFLEGLQQRHPVSASNAAIVAQAREGSFVAKSDSGAPPGDRPTLAFIRGLAALQQNQSGEATKAFQQALDGASDFLGAAFYLGAVHAANGRDGDAIGAWQMSLIGEGGQRAYPVLADALIRAGDAQGALDIVTESPDEAWPNLEAKRRRLVIAQAMTGQFAAALENATALLTSTPEDQDLLFVAIQVMYRRHLNAPLSADERTTFLDYAERYERQQGPHAPLVSSWRRYVSR